MPITYDEGDYVTVKLDVPEVDETTEVTLEVTSPSGVVSHPLVSPEDGDTWYAQVHVTEPGLWSVVWKVDGDGQGVEGDKLRVRPSLGLPTPESGDRLYATTADLARYMGDVPPDDALQALYVASRDLDNVLVGARYAVDENDYPSNPYTRKAFMRATCAQVVWTLNGNSDTEGELGAGIGTVSIGSLSVSAKQEAGGGQQGTRTGARTFSPTGLRLLQTQGLLPIRPYVMG